MVGYLPCTLIERFETNILTNHFQIFRIVFRDFFLAQH
jgi:hypothetical protein